MLLLNRQLFFLLFSTADPPGSVGEAVHAPIVRKHGESWCGWTAIPPGNFIVHKRVPFMRRVQPKQHICILDVGCLLRTSFARVTAWHTFFGDFRANRNYSSEFIAKAYNYAMFIKRFQLNKDLLRESERQSRIARCFTSFPASVTQFHVFCPLNQA